jgi:hypothetical protein
MIENNNRNLDIDKCMVVHYIGIPIVAKNLDSFRRLLACNQLLITPYF